MAPPSIAFVFQQDVQNVESDITLDIVPVDTGENADTPASMRFVTQYVLCLDIQTGMINSGVLDGLPCLGSSSEEAPVVARRIRVSVTNLGDHYLPVHVELNVAQQNGWAVRLTVNSKEQLSPITDTLQVELPPQLDAEESVAATD